MEAGSSPTSKRLISTRTTPRAPVALSSTPCLTLGKREASCLPRRLSPRKNLNKQTQSDVLSLNGLSPDQRQIISHYNKTFVPLGCLSVDKITPAVRSVLEHKDCTRKRFDELLNDQSQLAAQAKIHKSVLAYEQRCRTIAAAPTPRFCNESATSASTLKTNFFASMAKTPPRKSKRKNNDCITSDARSSR